MTIPPIPVAKTVTFESVGKCEGLSTEASTNNHARGGIGCNSAADKELSRDEPEVAANIGKQLEHMGLSTWSISVRRRVRDAIARLSPKNIIQTGAGIGHLSRGF